jgi:hypothetical protein
MNGIFYTGVVENRQDPTRLGRCQVRVVGLHSENKTELPTDLLPWAYPMQPVTSAAMNGIGFSPLGPVEGTWVVIFFRDQECQQPIMMGTLGGIPQDKEISSNYLNDGDDYLIKTDGGITDAGTGKNELEPGSGSTKPETAAENADAEEFIGPLTEDDVKKYKDNVARLETTSEPNALPDFSIKGIVGLQNYGVVNAQGRIGKYQFTAQALASLGYVKRVLNANGESVPPSNQKLADPTIWLGKQGAVDVSSFLTSIATQESAMDEWTRFNYVDLKRLGLIDDKTDRKIIFGYLSASHPDGVERAQALKANQDIDDGYGNTTTDLYKNGYSSVDGDQPKTLPQNVPAGVDADTVPLGELRPDGTPSDGTKTDGGVVFGFKDPNKKYPLKEHLNEPDTNRLARNDNINKTLVATKDATRTQKCPVAITGATWDQPQSPYNAAYPFNHTYQTESGHVQEFDDTPENERIHLYHKRGTFLEWDANGTQVNKIVGDGYHIVDRNGYVYIKGSCNLTVDGVTNVLFRSAANIEVIGDTNIVARNDVNMKVSGTMNLSVLEDLNIECQNFGLKTRNDAMIKTDNMFYATSANDMHLFSNKKLFINAQENLTISAAGNLFIQSDFSVNMKSKSNMNIEATGEQSFSAGGNFLIYTDKNIGMRSQVTQMRSFNRTDIVSVQAGVNIEGGPGVNINSGNATGLPQAGNKAVDAPLIGRPDNTAGEYGGVEGGVKDLEDPAARITPVDSFFAHLSLPPRHLSGASQFESPEEGDPTEFIAKQKQKGAVPQNESKPTPADTAPPVTPKQEGVPASCAAFANMTEFPLSTKLSPNFYLGDFIPGGGSGFICVASSPHKLRDQDGLTKAQIVCNLKGLAENVLENLIKIVPKSEIIITSGYRQKGLVGAESATSQHPKGQACDIVLKKFSRDRKKHFDLIKQIAAAVPHDQLILEYQDPGTVWIHISYTNSGKNKNQQFTMNNHRSSGPGFTLLV